MTKTGGAWIGLGVSAWLCLVSPVAAEGMSNGAASETAPAKEQSHKGGMSPAIWVAIFTAIWVPLLASGARRAREKKARETQNSDETQS